MYNPELRSENGRRMRMDKITDGLKHDGGKLRLSLVPAEAIKAIGAVMTHGAEKYGKDTYKQVEPERYRDALMRHVCKWLKDPHGKDEDSGLPHLWHIITNAAFLCELDKVTSYEEKLEAYKNLLAKQSLDVGHLKPNICEMTMTAEQVIDKLEQMRFFNQRMGRELWQDKPAVIQNIDIENTDRYLSEAIRLIRNKEETKE